MKEILFLLPVFCICLFGGSIAFGDDYTITNSTSRGLVQINSGTINLGSLDSNVVTSVHMFQDGSDVQTWFPDDPVEIPLDTDFSLSHTFTILASEQAEYYLRAYYTNTIANPDVENNYDDVTISGWNTGDIWAEKFSGPAGVVINNVAIYVITPETAGDASAMEYFEDHIIANATNDYQATSGPLKTGKIWAEKFSGLPAGANLKGMAINIASVAGNVRGKIYKADGSGENPLTILEQTNSIPISNTGVQIFEFNPSSPKVVPANGKIWVGLETNSNSLSLYNSTGLSAGSAVTYTHTYGPDGNFGTVVTQTTAPWIAVFYEDPSGVSMPWTGLGVNAIIHFSSEGVVNTATFLAVPSSGSVWVGIQTNSSSLELLAGDRPNIGVRFDHVGLGAASKPYGPRHIVDNAPWMRMSFNDNETSTNIQSNTLTVDPPPLPPSCGIFSCVPGTIAYDYLRSYDFSELTLHVFREPKPFNIECLVETGAFIRTGTWYNYTSIDSLDVTVPVISDQNAYVSCYGSGLLLSFVSPGSSALIVQGANVFNSTFGITLGAPIGTFFIAMLASMANHRTGPIYVVVVLGAMGVLSALLFFTVDSGAWALVILTGFLGIFVGKKAW